MAEAFYSGDFYEGMEDANLGSARAIVPLVFQYVQPKSVLDIGCGQGLWLNAFMEHGVTDVLGYDGDYVEREKLSIPKEKFIGTDLEDPISLERTFDLAMSLEVGEHLSDAASRAFVKNLTDAAPVILFSAAIPGQGGVRHINEQWPSYWEERFREQGYVPVDSLRHRVWGDSRVTFFYAQNTMFYVKESQLSHYPKLKEAHEAGHNRALSLVHPHIYTYYESRWNLIMPFVSMIPVTLLHIGKPLAQRLVRMPLAQIARYLISGGTAAAFYFAVLISLVELTDINYLLASTIGLTAAILVSFSLHKFFTFQEHAISRTHIQFALYIIVVAVDYAINLSVLWLAVEKLHLFYFVGAFIATVLVAAVNFILYRGIVFRRFARAEAH